MENDTYKFINEPRYSPNARKSPNRKRILVDGKYVWIPVRGNKKYFIYYFERNLDIYVYILQGIIFPIKDRDGFSKTDLKKVLSTKEEVYNYLKEISNSFNKKIMFSKYSIIINF